MKENKTDVVEVTTKKKTKGDELYIRYEDIEKELNHYIKHFKGKTILLNCDNPEWNNFWKYFRTNMIEFGIKKLIATHYNVDGSPSYKIELRKKKTIRWKKTTLLERKTPLNGNGDFRSEECVKLMQEADIVITNPPFSLFIEFVDLLEENNKKYILIGNSNLITYKETFKLIKENKLWLGRSGTITTFRVKLPQGSKHTYKQTKVVETKDGFDYIDVMSGTESWFTNVGTPADRPFVRIIEMYEWDKSKYPKYDNYDAINVNKAKDIPVDYKGVMGVPVTFLHKLNTEQFEIIGLLKDNKNGGESFVGEYPKINGKTLYSRLLIRRICE